MGAEQGPGPEAPEGQAASSHLCLGWDRRVSSALAEAWEGLVEDLAPGQESASPETPRVRLYGPVPWPEAQCELGEVGSSQVHSAGPRRGAETAGWASCPPENDTHRQ